jgi:hypothetical protein
MADAAYQLLIDCSHASCGAPHLAGAVALDAARIEDWEQVLSGAAFHGLLPNLTTALQMADWPATPPTVRERLERRHRQHVRQTLAQVSALYAICTRFQEARVPAVSWKGPLLARSLYGSHGARESGDLDFLMEPNEVAVGATLLKSMGFRRHCKTPTKRLDRKVARLDGDQGFYRAADNVYVELHAQPMPARFTAWQSRREYLRRAVPTPLYGAITVLTLRPEDQLLSLAGHAIKHHWERLKWVQDIALFLRVYQGRLDWAALLADTRRTGKSRAVVHALALAQTVFGTADVPVDVPTVMREAPEWAETAAITRHLAQVLQLEERGTASAEETNALTALLQSSVTAKLQFTVRRALEPQLSDFNDSFSGSPLLCKWHRVVQQAGARSRLWRAALLLRRSTR